MKESIAIVYGILIGLSIRESNASFSSMMHQDSFQVMGSLAMQILKTH